MRPTNPHLTPEGFETNFGEPVAVRAGLRLPQSTDDRLRAIIRSERFMQKMEELGQETFEEADDFSLPNNEQWLSPFENDFDPPPPAEQDAPQGHAEPKPDPTSVITEAAKASVPDAPQSV